MRTKTKHRLVTLPMVALFLGGVISCGDGPPRRGEGRGGAAAGGDDNVILQTAL